MTTETTAGARAHARAQAGQVAEAMPAIPASSYDRIPKGVESPHVIWAETVAGGGYTSKTISRGATIRLTDRCADACAHLLLYNAEETWERLCVADTVKVPWQAYVSTAHPLLSDQGRVLATVITDTTGGSHDALAGCSSRLRNEERYGDGSAYGPSPAGRELFRLAAAKHGLGPRDIPPSISFFKRVRVSRDGALNFEGSAGPGYVEIRAELPLTVLIANAPHPLDPRPMYACAMLEVVAWRGTPTTIGDPLWSSTPELERAFLNTADYADARGLQ